MKRTIRWILLIAVVAAAGYYGWNRYYGPEAIAKAIANGKAMIPTVTPARKSLLNVAQE